MASFSFIIKRWWLEYILLGDIMRKKKVFMLAIVFVLLCGLSVCLVACKKDNMEMYLDNISEARYNYFCGEVAGYRVTFTAGMREQDFKLDGYHTDSIEFGVITIELPNDMEYSGVATYRLEYGNNVTSGTLEKNPFDGTFMADTGFVINDVDTMRISFKMGEVSKSIEMIDYSKNFNLNYSGAFAVFVENVEGIEDFLVDDEFQAEVYIKIMHDDTIDVGYYFLIRVIGRSGKVLSGIVNPMNGEILAVTSSRL